MSRNKLLKKADEYVNNLSIGLGRGFSNQLEGILSMIESPVQTAKGFAALASNPSQIPGMVRNALSDAATRATSGPMGFGEVIGENIGPSMFRRAPVMREMTTYHGSPHQFDKFDIAKVGTGEGAQAYGHGMYFAERPQVAQTYSQIGSRPVEIGDERYLPTFLAVAERRDPKAKAYEYLTASWDGQHENPFAHAKQMLQQLEPNKVTTKEALAVLDDWRNRGATLGKAGYLYTVDLPDEHIANMLDWDKPLSEQPPAVQRALAKLDPSVTSSGQKMWAELSRPGFASTPTESPQAAAAWLNSQGIPGIRYLDGGSRGAGQGTSNFVVFDPSITTILNRE